MSQLATRIKKLHTVLGDILNLDKELQNLRREYNDLVDAVAEEWTSEAGYPEQYLLEWDGQTLIVQLKRNVNPTPGESEFFITIDEIEVVS